MLFLINIKYSLQVKTTNPKKKTVYTAVSSIPATGDGTKIKPGIITYAAGVYAIHIEINFDSYLPADRQPARSKLNPYTLS